jgi:CBS-domain-containing membrane protein
MNASDIMVSDVITVKSSGTVQEVAELLLRNRISALPVVDDAGKLVGMVSEGDLIHRGDAGTGHDRPWWLRLLMGRDVLAAEFVRENSRTVADVMTRGVISAVPDTPVADVAMTLERHRIKRVPIVHNGKIVGIVSRANLIQALAAARNDVLPPQRIDDAALREKIFSRLRSEPWAKPSLVNVTVSDGTVDLWGIVDTPAEKQALRVAVQVTPGVKAVNDNLIVQPAASVAY